jgi:hypothetical protein
MKNQEVATRMLKIVVDRKVDMMAKLKYSHIADFVVWGGWEGFALDKQRKEPVGLRSNLRGRSLVPSKLFKPAQ